MSAREWQPGDVASILTTGTQPALRTALGWTYIDGSTQGVSADNYLFRPLVVIDPEDAEQVERLVTLYCNQFPIARGIEDGLAMADALREFANPSPAEPTDPKAYVSDRRENIWRLLADGDWVCTSGPDIGEYITWARLVANYGPVSIEGVTA